MPMAVVIEASLARASFFLSGSRCRSSSTISWYVEGGSSAPVSASPSIRETPSTLASVILAGSAKSLINRPLLLTTFFCSSSIGFFGGDILLQDENPPAKKSRKSISITVFGLLIIVSSLTAPVTKLSARNMDVYSRQSDFRRKKGTKRAQNSLSITRSGRRMKLRSLRRSSHKGVPRPQPAALF